MRGMLDDASRNAFALGNKLDAPWCPLAAQSLNFFLITVAS